MNTRDINGVETEKVINNIITRTISIALPKNEVQKITEILAIEEGDYPEEDHDAVIVTYTVRFSDGCFADIKLCNGDTPYIDNVLFNKDGCQVDVPEIGEAILGEYLFSYNKTDYIVLIKEEE